jgi:AbrB family looped-hinge helix DNA binding protein
MTTLKISDKGQITLPATMRRKLRLEPQSRVTVEVRDDAIVLRPVKSIKELEGIFHAYVPNPPLTWEEEREIMERAVAEEVSRE